MNPSTKRMPPQAAELFKIIQQAYQQMGDSPIVSQRKVWFEFVLAMHDKSATPLTGPEFYAFLTNERNWRNDLAQILVTEYNLAMELLDFLKDRSR